MNTCFPPRRWIPSLPGQGKFAHAALVGTMCALLHTPSLGQARLPEDQAAIRLVRQHTPGRVDEAAMLDGGRRLAILGSAAWYGNLTIHETAHGQTLATVALEERCKASMLRAEPAGTHLVLVTSDTLVCRLTASGALDVVRTQPLPQPVSAAFSRDGSLLALGNADGGMVLLDWPSGRLRWHRTISPASAYLIDLAFTADDKALVICCGDRVPPKPGTVLLVDVGSGEVLRRAPASGTALAVAPDGKSVAVLAERLQVLSLPTLQPLWSASALPASGKRVQGMGYINRSGVLHAFNGDWYFVNSQRQLMRAQRGRPISTQLTTVGPPLLIEQRDAPPAWISNGGLARIGSTVPLPAEGGNTLPLVVISPNQQWLLMAKENRLQRFDLLRGYSSIFAGNVGFAPDSIGVDDQGNISSHHHGTKMASMHRELPDRPRYTQMLSRNGQTVLATFSNGVHWRNVVTGRTLALPHLAKPLASQGDALLFLAQDGSAHCANADLGTDRVIGVKIETLDGVQLTPDGRYVAIHPIGKPDSLETIDLWSCDSGAKTARMRTPFVGNFIMVDARTALVKNASDDRADGGQWFIDDTASNSIQRVTADLGDVQAIAGDRAIGVMPDQTVRITNFRTGALLATLSLQDKENWLVVAPDGRFDTSRLQDNAALRWVGADRPLAPVPIEAFYRDRYEPNLLAKIWRGDKLATLPPFSSRNLERPLARIVDVRQAGENMVDVEVEVSAAAAAGARHLRLARDGMLVASLPAWTTPPGTPFRHVFRAIGLPTARFETDPPTTLSTWAFNADGVRGDTGSRTVSKSVRKLFSKPRAFLLTIGVNWHENPAWNLAYAVNDARTLAQTLSRSLAARGMEVFSANLLSNGAADAMATKTHIREAIERLSGTFAPGQAAPASMQGWPQPGPDDLVFISFSGHGFSTGDGAFFLLPQDTGPGTRRDIDAAQQARAISMDELYKWLEGADANIAIVLDACNSSSAIGSNAFRPGPGDSRTLGQLAYDKGITLLAAAAGDQSAIEIDTLQHGLLTWVLVEEGLREGKANAAPVDRRITVREWLRYAVARTPGLAAEIQQGQIGKRGTILVNSLPQLAGAPARQQPVLFDYGQQEIIVHDTE